MKLFNTPMEKSTEYRVVGINITDFGTPDSTKHYVAAMDKKHSISDVRLADNGVLLAINATPPAPKQPKNFVPARAKRPLNPKDFMSQDILSAGSSAKMAELIAKEIYDIRDSRNQLSRGEADFMPKDGTQLKLMLANLNRQETALRQLFEGEVTKDTTWVTVDCMPTKEGSSILFRFSKYLGLVDIDDLAPAPAPAGQKEDKGDIGLRVSKPSRIRLTLQHDNDIVATYEMNAAQFGTVESLSGDLFGKKQSASLLLDPMTGSVKEIKQITPQLPYAFRPVSALS